MIICFEIALFTAIFSPSYPYGRNLSNITDMTAPLRAIAGTTHDNFRDNEEDTVCDASLP